MKARYAARGGMISSNKDFPQPLLDHHHLAGSLKMHSPTGPAPCLLGKSMARAVGPEAPDTVPALSTTIGGGKTASAARLLVMNRKLEHRKKP